MYAPSVLLSPRAQDLVRDAVRFLGATPEVRRPRPRDASRARPPPAGRVTPSLTPASARAHVHTTPTLTPTLTPTPTPTLTPHSRPFAAGA